MYGLTHRADDAEVCTAAKSLYNHDPNPYFDPVYHWKFDRLKKATGQYKGSNPTGIGAAHARLTAAQTERDRETEVNVDAAKSEAQHLRVIACGEYDYETAT